MKIDIASCPVGRFAVCEFLGSMFLVIAAVSPIILFTEILGASIALAVVADALAVGFILFALIEVFTPRCTAYFNPAVTLAMALAQKISWRRAGILGVNQICGGLAGVVLAHAMFYHEISRLVEISAIERSGGTYVAEVLGTFLLGLAIMQLGFEKPEKTPLAVGMLVGGMLLATSSTMFANPQVAIARMFTYCEAGIRPVDAGVFVIVEMVGAVLAVGVWRYIRRVSTQ
jgi:glycerol uptake facilitator-like aquaporin